MQFIVSFLREGLDRAGPAFAEIVAPIGEDFRRSGMTEDEFDVLIEQGRQAMWDEKRP